EGDVVTVGITDHAQEELTDIVYLELPEVGRVVDAGEEIAVIESVKSASDIYSPVAGEVVEVNEATGEDTGKVNTDPYGDGWMFKIKVSGEDALEHLMDVASYCAHIG
ncbi:MAG: glycine cleavage system protein GcvH, partial [Verrucomicrobiota bacterium]